MTNLFTSATDLLQTIGNTFQDLYDTFIGTSIRTLISDLGLNLDTVDLPILDQPVVVLLLGSALITVCVYTILRWLIP